MNEDDKRERRFFRPKKLVDEVEEERIAAPVGKNDFENPFGCLWGKPGCEGNPIRVKYVASLKQSYFFCKCGFDTPTPRHEVYKLAQGYGLIKEDEEE